MDASEEELINHNIILMSRYLSEDRSFFIRAEKVFRKIFSEYHQVHHYDSYHGSESLLYHQYMVMHSLDVFLDTIVEDYNANDKSVKLMQRLVDTIVDKTLMGRKELKNLLNQPPPKCSKPFKIILFLVMLFHDLGKLYNTELLGKKLGDETLQARKFTTHDRYGWNLFQYFKVRRERSDQVIEEAILKTRKKITSLKNKEQKLKSVVKLPDNQIIGAKSKVDYDKELKQVSKEINIFKLDLEYLEGCKERIFQLRELLEEFNLTKGDLHFISKLIKHHQALFNQKDWDYSKYVHETDAGKLKLFVEWCRVEKFKKAGIRRRSKSNTFFFYGLLLAAMSDVTGTGYSDHTVEKMFETDKFDVNFKGHHGDISPQAEFLGFLAYLYHNLSLPDERIIKNWFSNVEMLRRVA